MSTELLTQIFEICILPLCAILTRYAVKYFKAKSDQLCAQTDSVLEQKYIKKIEKTITECVIATNQTYVDSLKKQGKFDAEAQKEAFEKSFNAVLKVLSEEEKSYIVDATGDLQAYLINKIEATVNGNKAEK